MRYRRGTQIDKLEDLPTHKANIVMNGTTEGIWVKQGADYVVLQNHALHFYPFHSWGCVFSSKNPPGNRRETIDVSYLQPTDGLELHPEAWDSYLVSKTMDAEGNWLNLEETLKETTEKK